MVSHVHCVSAKTRLISVRQTGESEQSLLETAYTAHDGGERRVTHWSHAVMMTLEAGDVNDRLSSVISFVICMNRTRHIYEFGI